LTTNSDTPLVRALFEGFELHKIEARREINLDSTKRNIGELLIANYEVRLRTWSSEPAEAIANDTAELAG
jgi:hypothetical protein